MRPAGRRLPPVALLLLVLATTPAARAADDCGAPCADGVPARTKALAYLDEGNRVWAAKTLMERLDAEWGDIQTRSWVVWLLMMDGDLERAGALIAGADIDQPGPMAERFALLRVTLSRLQGDNEQAGAQLREIEEGIRELYPEDVVLLRDLRSTVLGNPGDPIRVRVLFDVGYTTNATESAPQDIGSGQEQAGAPVLGLDAVVQVAPWASPLVRPVGELRGKAFAPLSEQAMGYSYLGLGARGGGELGRADGFRLRLLYSYELLGIRDRGWFMIAHRGELELDVVTGLQVFAGAGRRTYQHLPRTRTEVDAGVAGVLALPGGWNLTGIAAGRIQTARNQAFDDRGFTGLARVKVPLPRDGMIKLRVMFLYDHYPNSADYYGLLRWDAMVKVAVGPWTPSFHGFRIGGTYTLAHRESTIESPKDNFTYTDHRFQLQLRWGGSVDPTLPRRADVAEDHLPLPYGFDQGGDSGLDRVQDLLRQEDSARRGSSCVD